MFPRFQSASPPPTSSRARRALRAEVEADLEAERLLALELAAVLQHSLSGQAAAAHSSTTMADEFQLDRDEADADIEWRTGERLEDEFEVAAGGAPISARWLKKARRDRRRERARQALAWVTTLLVGGLVIAAVAYLLTGWRPDFTALLDLARRAVG